MTAGPTGRSYWVVPGRFAAGAYPSTRDPAPDGRIDVVEALLTAGIDDFVNLTQDRPGGTDEHLRHYDAAVGDRGTVSRFEIPDLGTEPLSFLHHHVRGRFDDICRRLQPGKGRANLFHSSFSGDRLDTTNTCRDT